MTRSAFVTTLLATAIAANAETILLSSGEQQTTLLELFTSEGCSSCPPAEEWLSKLSAHPGLWKEFVPAAFHVDYWDYLGWKDRFAAPAFTSRQRAYADAWRSRQVYTPGFVADGREWRWSRHGSVPKASGNKPGILQVARADDGKLAVRFPARGEWDAHLAWLGNELTVKVDRGENARRTLRHDFVVLALQSAPVTAGAASFSESKRPAEAGKRLALAAWVTPRGSLTPVQATGGWLP
jgi:hypothetical protein